jgi:hypothetical protein
VTASGTTPLPGRQIVRLQGEFHMSGIVALRRLLPGEYTRGVLLMAVIRACVADWTGGDRPAPPPIPRDGLSILSAAQSLHCPFETARRHIRILIAEGYCATDGRRVFLATSGPRVAALCRYFCDTHDIFLRLVEAIDALGLIPNGKPPPERHALRQIIQASLDQSLLPFEVQREPFVSWIGMAVWGAIAAATVRHVTEDPLLSREFATVATPDALRRPVSIRRAAAALTIPHATAWRHGRDLADRGLISPSGAGWIIADQNLTDDRLAGGIAASISYVLRKARETVAHGLDPARIGERYLIERPPYMAFD